MAGTWYWVFSWLIFCALLVVLCFSAGSLWRFSGRFPLVYVPMVLVVLFVLVFLPLAKWWGW